VPQEVRLVHENDSALTTLLAEEARQHEVLFSFVTNPNVTMVDATGERVISNVRPNGGLSHEVPNPLL